jgi:flagellar basal-body rod protein FlgF
MSDGIYSALSGAIAQERNLGVVANNVANVKTHGFQGDKVLFSDLTAQENVGRPRALHFVSAERVTIDQSRGGLEQTGNPLDVALQGDAYFVVQAPGGERYTRAGSFVLDSEGTLRTHSGNEVVGDSGSLTIPQGTKIVRIAPDGSIHADGQEVGKLKLVQFSSPQGLTKEGLTLLVAGAGAAQVEAVNVSVEQGYLEGANVNAVSSMNELINVNRTFDALQKVIESFKQIDERTVRDLAR